MSYDYEALTTSIQQNLEKAKTALEDPSKNGAETTVEAQKHWEVALDTFAKLSSHCPMTPLLWIQYSKTTFDWINSTTDDKETAQSTRAELLELGLQEFPGSSLLNLAYLDSVEASQKNGDTTEGGKERELIEKAYMQVLQNVGRGSHRNEDVVVRSIFRRLADHYAKQHEQAHSVFVLRARTPIKDDYALEHEYLQFCEQHQLSAPKDLQEERRWQQATYQFLASCEDQITASMDKEGVLFEPKSDEYGVDWSLALSSSTVGMGLAGEETVKAFQAYIRTCEKYENEVDPTAQKSVQGLIIPIYERAVAECPTAESLWVGYLNHLAKTNEVSRGKTLSVAIRATRNCPYSLILARRRIEASTGAGHLLEPDELVKQVEALIAQGFLTQPEQMLELYWTAIRLVQQHIIGLVLKGSKWGAEDWEAPPKKQTKNPKVDLSDDDQDEIQDWLEDLTDFYDMVQKRTSWSHGRSLLLYHRAIVEEFLIQPLKQQRIGAGMQTAPTSLLRSFTKAATTHKPPHPRILAGEIRSYAQSFEILTPVDVGCRIIHVRGLYRQAVKGTNLTRGNKIVPSLMLSEYEASLYQLGQEWLEFEQALGSDASYTRAKEFIRHKLSKHRQIHKTGEKVVDSELALTTEDNVPSTSETPTTVTLEGPDPKKRKIEQVQVNESGEQNDPPAKKLRVQNDPKVSETKETTDDNTQDSKQKKKSKFHAFTIRVFNLSMETMDADVANTFRNRCGPLVHARIIREKSYHNKGESKGWALVQFEDRESVDKALALSGEIGLNDKLLTINRSVYPAVDVLPAGMHRVLPKGEGRSSKRNQRRKEHNESGGAKEHKEDKSNDVVEEAREPAKATSKATSSTGSSVLAFRPRGVQTKRKGRTKVDL